MKSSSTDTLPASDLLAGFTDEDRTLLCSYGRFVSFKPDEIVIQEGKQQDSLYFLVEGIMHAVHQMAGGASPVGGIAEGEWFGEINILDPCAASATVVARTPSRAWCITRGKLEEFLNARPELGCSLILGVGEVLSRRVRALLEKLNATWDLSL